MTLSVVSINPHDQQLNVPIDRLITLTFSQAIDPFTVKNGLAVYTHGGQSWTGSELASLATKTSDIASLGLQNNYLDFSYTLSEDKTILQIVPTSGFLPEAQYYVQIFPGTDATRYLSTSTTNSPTYTKSLTTPSSNERNSICPPSICMAGFTYFSNRSFILPSISVGVEG